MRTKLISGSWFTTDTLGDDDLFDLNDYIGENPPFMGVVGLNPHAKTKKKTEIKKKWILLKSKIDSMPDAYEQYEKIFETTEIEFPYDQEITSELYLRWAGKYSEKPADESPTDYLNRLLHEI